MVIVLTYLKVIDETQVRRKCAQNRVDGGEKKWMKILVLRTYLSD